MAYRATDPNKLLPLSREIRFGPDNRKHILYALREAGTVICGWGKKGHLGPVDWVATIARTMGVTLYALKINMDGTPQHPLYIPYSKEPEWFGGANGWR
ncbi:MAG: DUF1643 domain-containing protein [Rhizobiaceae bacterium]|nr:DUF1643 domain-containing protein [Paracoccaceae bacterium]MBL4733606.1 DUF1643 domain-containing protein [Rhizobiaceae bacterium]